MYDVRLDFFSKDNELPFYAGYCRHDKDFFPHRHLDFSELVIVTGGSAVHNVDGKRYPIGRGDVFVVGGQTVHSFENAERLTVCNIMYRPELLAGSARDLSRSEGFHALFLSDSQPRFSAKMKLSDGDYSVIGRLVEEMTEEFGEKGACRRTCLYSQFLLLVVELSRIYDRGRDEGLSALSRALSYIQQHYTENISLDALAELTHYSTRHFIRLFKQEYSMTPYDYILDLRIKLACRLIENSGSSIGRIAENSGFDDSNYFSRAFKKRVGISPMLYRKRVAGIYAQLQSHGNSDEKRAGGISA